MWGLCDGGHGSGQHSRPSEMRGKYVTVCLRSKERLFNVAPGVPSWGREQAWVLENTQVCMPWAPCCPLPTLQASGRKEL